MYINADREEEEPLMLDSPVVAEEKGDAGADPSRQSGQSPISLLSGSRPCSFWPLSVCAAGLDGRATIYNLRRRKAAHVHRASPQPEVIASRPSTADAAAIYCPVHNDFVHFCLLCFFLLLLLLLLMRSIDHCPMALQLLAPFFFPPFLFWLLFFIS